MLPGSHPPAYIVYFNAAEKLDPSIEADLDREHLDLSGSPHVHP